MPILTFAFSVIVSVVYALAAAVDKHSASEWAGVAALVLVVPAVVLEWRRSRYDR